MSEDHTKLAMTKDEADAAFAEMLRKHDANVTALLNNTVEMRAMYEKLLTIIACSYQVIGALALEVDGIDTVLDVLCDPESANPEQVEALQNYSIPLVESDRQYLQDAMRYRFRKKFLADGGAILHHANGVQYRMKNEYLVGGATEEEALDYAMKAQG